MIVGPVRPIIALLLALFLVACQGLGDDQDGADGTEQPTAQLTDEPAKTDEPELTDEPAKTDEPVDTASPEATEDGTVSPFELEIGDCFNVEEDADSDVDELVKVELIDCEEEHLFEVFEFVNHPAGDDDEYPGDEAIRDFAFEECELEFEDYVGVSYDDSTYYIAYLWPSDESWEAGDREIVCTVHQGREPTPAEGSARDSGE